MIIPGSSYWNLGIGRLPGEVLKDEEGLKTMETLGQNMAWLLKETLRIEHRAKGKKETAKQYLKFHRHVILNFDSGYHSTGANDVVLNRVQHDTTSLFRMFETNSQSGNRV